MMVGSTFCPTNCDIFGWSAYLPDAITPIQSLNLHLILLTFYRTIYLIPGTTNGMALKLVRFAQSKCDKKHIPSFLLAVTSNCANWVNLMLSLTLFAIMLVHTMSCLLVLTACNHLKQLLKVNHKVWKNLFWELNLQMLCARVWNCHQSSFMADNSDCEWCLGEFLTTILLALCHLLKCVN